MTQCLRPWACLCVAGNAMVVLVREWKGAKACVGREQGQ